MSTHVLPNVLNELKEKDKMRGHAEHSMSFPPRAQQARQFVNTKARFIIILHLKPRFVLDLFTKVAVLCQ